MAQIYQDYKSAEQFHSSNLVIQKYIFELFWHLPEINFQSPPGLILKMLMSNPDLFYDTQSAFQMKWKSYVGNPKLLDVHRDPTEIQKWKLSWVLHVNHQPTLMECLASKISIIDRLSQTLTISIGGRQDQIMDIPTQLDL